MNQWIDNLQAVLQLMLGNPGSTLEMWVLLGLSFLVMWAVVSKAGNLLGMIEQVQQ